MKKLISGILVLLLCSFAAYAQTGSVLTVDNLVVSNSATFYGNVKLTGPMPIDVSSGGLALFYDFATNGAFVTDLSGSGNSGSVSGATWTAGGRTNGAYVFDATNDSIQVTSSISLSPTNQLTIMAWIKLDTAISSTYPMIVTKNPSSGASSGQSGNYEFRVNNNGTLYFSSQYSTSASQAAGGIRRVDDRAWHMVGVTVDATSRVVRLYVDGQLDNAVTVANRPISYTNAEPVRIGMRKDGYYFDGVIDEVRIYGRALSPSEMTQAYAYYLQQPNAAVLTANQFNQSGFLQTNAFMGNVAIGTNVATNALNVAGAVSATRFAGDGSALLNIGGGNIVNASIAGAKLANNTITATQIATNAVLTGVNVDMVDGKHAADLATASQGARLDLLNSVLTLSNQVSTTAEAFDTGWADAPWTNFQINVSNPQSGWVVNNAMVTTSATLQSSPYVCVFKEFSATNAWIKSPILPNGYSSIVFGMKAVSNNAPIVIALESSYDGATWATLGSYSNAATNLNWCTFTNIASGSQMYSSQYLRLRKMTESTNAGYRVQLDSIAIAAPVPHVIMKELQVENVVGPVNFAGATVNGLTASAVSGLGSAAAQDAASFATAAQGARADTALQPVATQGLVNVTLLGSAAFVSTQQFATAEQGARADSGLQPGANGVLQDLFARGNVGVGTNNPTARLHIAGDGRFEAGISFAAPLGNMSMGSYTNKP